MMQQARWIACAALAALAMLTVTAMAQDRRDAVQTALAKTAAPYIAQLEDKDVQVRLAAVRQLGHLGPAAASAALPLTRAMKEVGLREQAAGALGRMGPAVLPALAQALDDRDPFYRVRVLQAVWQIAETSELPANLVTRVIAQLDPEQPADLRNTAAAVIAQLGPKGAPATAALIESFSKPEKGVQSSMAAALAAIGPDALPRLQAAMNDKRGPVLMGVAEALGRMGPAAAPAVGKLSEWLVSDNWQLRLSAATALAGMGDAAAPAVDRLVHIAWQTPPPDRIKDAQGPEAFGPLFAHQAAERALIRLGPVAAPALEFVLAELTRYQSNRRVAAIETIRAIGPAAAGAVPGLVDLLKAPDPPMPSLIVSALARIGKPAVPSAIALMGEEVLLLQAAGIEIVRQVGPDAAAAVDELVKRLAADQPAVVQVAAMDALTALKQAAAPSAVAVARIARTRDVVRVPVKDPEPGEKEFDEYDLRSRAFATLSAIGKPAVPTLLELLADKDDVIRRETAAALGRIGPDAQSAVAPLIALLGDKSQSVRLAAPLALARIGKPAVGPLMEASRASDAAVRNGAVEALARIGGEAILPAVDRLIDLAGDRDPRVAGSAIWALGTLPPRVLSAKPVQDAIVAGLDAKRPVGVRMSAAAAVAGLPEPTPQLVAMLGEMLKDKDLAASAADGLLGIGETAYSVKRDRE